MNKWDRLFMDVATRYAEMSLDPSSKVGCVIAKGKFQVSQGYNGLPRGISDTSERLNNRELKLALVLHSEENAMLWARKEDLIGATLYCTHVPCSRCASKIIQVGIKKVIYKKPTQDFNARYADNIKLSLAILREAGVFTIECEISL